MRNPITSRRPQGFTLIEAMVALTIGLILLTIMSLVFVANGSYRNDLDRSSRLVENGTYALQRVSGDAMLAGFYAELDVATDIGKSLPATAVKPDPCLVTLAGLRSGLPFYVQGYAAPNSTTKPALTGTTCAALLQTPTLAVSDLRAGSDILVVRHTEPCAAGPTADTGCDTAVAGIAYFQASHCADEAPGGSYNATCDTTLNRWCALDNDYTALTHLHNIGLNCSTGATSVASYHRYYVDIWFVTDNDNVGDGIPTLKLAQLDVNSGATAFAVSPIAEGIETMQLEYGIDNSTVLDGVADAYTADPDTFTNTAGCPGTATACPKNWGDVTAIKIHLLGRNTEATPGGYTNDKTFTLGLKADGTANTYGPFNDKFKRHVYETSVRLRNPADRRQQ